MKRDRLLSPNQPVPAKQGRVLPCLQGGAGRDASNTRKNPAEAAKAGRAALWGGVGAHTQVSSVPFNRPQRLAWSQRPFLPQLVFGGWSLSRDGKPLLTGVFVPIWNPLHRNVAQFCHASYVHNYCCIQTVV